MATADNVVSAMGLRAAPADAGDPAAPTNEQAPTKPTPGGTPLTDAATRALGAQAVWKTVQVTAASLPALEQAAHDDPNGHPASPDGTPSTIGKTNAELYAESLNNLSAGLKEMNTLGLGPGGAALTAAESAAIGEAQARLAVDQAHYQNQDATAARNSDETARANKAVEAQNAQDEADKVKAAQATADATQRQNNVTNTLDLLQQQVAMGNMTAQQARDKATAAFNAANVQRDIIGTNAPWALPAGTQFMPGLGPTDNIAALAKGMGLPFSPLGTGGTYQVDPNAIAAPITAAANSGGPSFDQAAQQAALQRVVGAMGIAAQPRVGAPA